MEPKKAPPDADGNIKTLHQFQWTEVSSAKTALMKHFLVFVFGIFEPF